MNNDRKQSISSENSYNENVQDFKFRRHNERALTHFNTGKEIYYFKDEILKDMKELEKNLTDKFNIADLNIIDNIKILNEEINTLSIKLKELSTKITTDNSIKEKVDNLEIIKTKILDDITVNDMKLNTLDKEIRQSVNDMNDILKDTVIYTGIIGPTCKFKTFHNYIDYTINELNILETYKEKNIMDLSSFKKKIESSIHSFKMNLDSFGRSSKEYTTDNYNQVNKKMNELFRKCNDKIEDVKIKHDEKIMNVQNKVNDIESKFINELDGVKERISALEKDMNNQIKFYFNLKDEVSQLKENMVVKKSKRNSLKNNDINNVINKSKVKKRSIIIKNDTMEEIKNNSMDQIDNLTQYNNENNMSSFINKSLNKLESSEEDIKEIKSIKKEIKSLEKKEKEFKINENDKLNIINKNLNINVDNPNNFDLDNYIKKTIQKRIDKEKNHDHDKNKLVISSVEQEEEKQKSFSPKRQPIPIKNAKQEFNYSSHSIKSENSKNSKISIKITEDQNNFETIKSMNKLSETEIKKEKEKEKPIINLKAQKTDKNIFNRNFDLFKEQNKFFFSDKNKKNDIKKQKSIIDIKSLNIDNNNNIINAINDKLNFNFQRTAKSSSKFKNIILTLEGTKKMVYDTNDFHRGKNLYHIETLSYKNSKKSFLRERLESCKPFLMKKNYKKNLNKCIFPVKDEPNELMKYVNNKLFLLNKSSSSKIYLKNKNSADYDYKGTSFNNNFSPSLNIIKYNPTPKIKKYKSSEEKSLQTEKK